MKAISLKKDKFRAVIELALKEDIGRKDITTSAIIPEDYRVKALIISREDGILCGTGVARFTFALVDKSIKVSQTLKDGYHLKQGETIMRLEGYARGILSAERTALNFLGRLSGIATLAHQFVTKVSRYKVKIMDTRKTNPGLRYLEKYAVRVGGGYNHRMGLYDGVLIKDNHLKVIGDRLWVMGLKKVKDKISSKFKIEIEVKTLKEFKKALKIKPDVIMLDNMNLKDIREAVELRNSRAPSTQHRTPLLEVSGGVTLSNVCEIASTGVERVSIGAITHSAKWLDIALEIVY